MAVTDVIEFNRRMLLAGGAAGVASLTLGGEALGASVRRDEVAKFRNALGISPHPDRLFDRGMQYRDGRRTARNLADLQRIYMAHGGSEVFARMGSSRVLPLRGGSSRIAEGWARARVARELDVPLNPELMLCGTYGDVGGQPAPDFSNYPEISLRAPWHELTIDEMASAMEIYGEIAAREILGFGVRVNYWDIGNEIDFGIAGVAIQPDANYLKGYRPPDRVNPEIGKMTKPRFYGLPLEEKISWCQINLWPYVARILSAVASGIRKVDPQARFMTHCSAFWIFPEVFSAFYTAMDAGNFRTEQLGVSYFPTNVPFKLDRFKQTALMAKAVLGRPLFLAEFAYPAAQASHNGENWTQTLEGYPATPQGQADFYRDLTEWGVSSGTIAGIRPYGVDEVEGGWAGMAFFEKSAATIAVARPAISAIQRGVQRAAGKSVRA